jgi:hypothetical protein
MANFWSSIGVVEGIFIFRRNWEDAVEEARLRNEAG